MQREDLLLCARAKCVYTHVCLYAEICVSVCVGLYMIMCRYLWKNVCISMYSHICICVWIYPLFWIAFFDVTKQEALYFRFVYFCLYYIFSAFFSLSLMCCLFFVLLFYFCMCMYPFDLHCHYPVKAKQKSFKNTYFVTGIGPKNPVGMAGP